VATLEMLSSRLRNELGDMGRTFEETFSGDGSTKRYQLTTAPVKGATLVVKVGATNVSNTTSVEEQTGMVVLAVAPVQDAVISITGTTYKYFTDAEIEYYINTAFAEHARTTTDSNGSKATILSLPGIDEYPLVILASTMALYTLATDASFDIDIISPDGVSIPRSERFRQLSEIITSRKEQYRELCNLLGIGLHKIEVFNLRRISRLTNKLVPIYRPQEIDDSSLPQRVRLSIPTYGDITPESDVVHKDLSMYSGDDFSIKLKFSLNLAGYTPKAEIRLFHTGGRAQVGPVIVGTFTIVKLQSIAAGIYDVVQLSLPGSVTSALPRTAYYDIQLTEIATGKVRTYMSGKVFTEEQVTL
jgi:hypothetical protein